MKSTSHPTKPWAMRTVAAFIITFVSYLTWHAEWRVTLLIGCMMLASLLIELGKFEWVQWQLRRARRERPTC